LTREPRRSLRWRVGAGFILAGHLLCVVSLLIPGYVRSGWWNFCFTGITVATLLLFVFSVAVRPDSPWIVHGEVYGTDAFIVISLASLTDHGSARVGAVLFALPTMFMALFQSWRHVVAQAIVITASSSVLMWLGHDPFPILAIHTACVVAAGIVPAVGLLIMRAQLEASLARESLAASTDPLTGLANRRGLTEAAPEVIRTAQAEGLEVVVVMGDLDHFKRVNDRLGHATGDTVLQRVGETLRASTRPGDVVARLGGEEFLIMLALQGSDAPAFGERIREKVAQDLEDVAVTISLGATWIDHRSFSGDTETVVWSLVDRADGLVYAAKNLGRNCLAHSAMEDRSTTVGSGPDLPAHGSEHRLASR